MSELGDLIERAAVPRVVKGRLTAAQRTEAAEAIRSAADGVRAGTSQRAFWTEILGAVVEQIGGAGSAYMNKKAAEAMLKIAEAKVAEASTEGE